ncbi:hypothetical protein [Halorarum halobium]|uniref:hypothetical protein n=1 Tax=Halorarum halobium TaxID=3075121 RepID=UPI0028AB0C73|nr:hypothetical protein [Halobaculum sp. XH14]
MDISNLLGDRLTAAEHGGRDVLQSGRVVSILVLFGALAAFFLLLVALSYL